LTPSKTPLGNTRPHILIVTHDDELAEFLSEGLTLAGFWTSRIASEIQTLEVFRLRTFDLALVDAGLPGLGAHELLKRLRSPRDRGAPATDLPIVIIVGNVAEIDALPVSRDSVDDVVAPPVELGELAARLFGIVQRWRSANPGRPWADEIAQQRPHENELDANNAAP
jgi:two-component system KDP operon response regulator KdpE